MAKQANAPTAAELAANIDKLGLWSTLNGDTQVVVSVMDARHLFGRLEFKITPIAGTGSGAWVSANNVDLTDKATLKAIMETMHAVAARELKGAA